MWRDLLEWLGITMPTRIAQVPGCVVAYDALVGTATAFDAATGSATPYDAPTGTVAAYDQAC